MKNLIKILIVCVFWPSFAWAKSDFLFLCEMSWAAGSAATARCMKEEFGRQHISEGALRAIHRNHLDGMRKKMGQAKCKTSTHKTRMSLDLRTVCKEDGRILEFASIWPKDERTKIYFRSSRPQIIENKILEFFRRTHFSRQNETPLFDWSR